MSKFLILFKLFNNIKDSEESEVLACLELKALCGEVVPVRNISDILYTTPFSFFTHKDIRIQDFLLYELPYGKVQGYLLCVENPLDIAFLVRRLAYTREIFLVTEGSDPQPLIKVLFPSYPNNNRIQTFCWEGRILFRFITNQYFLEKSEYISKLSRNEKEVDNNVDILLKYPTEGIYRIPSPETSKVGRRLEDYFALREENSLYLTHYMHPYKGKFHPKLARALLNYVYPKQRGIVLDNFAGSGTLLVEAIFSGLDSLGVEINPLSALMSNVKCHCLKIDLKALRESVAHYIGLITKKIKEGPLFSSKHKDNTLNLLPKYIIEQFKSVGVISEILSAKELLDEFRAPQIKDFLLLSLSGTISDLYRRSTSITFLEAIQSRLKDLYLRVYLFHRLNEFLQIPLGSALTYIEDARDMKSIDKEVIDGIVTSPPYSTALDYIKNDEPQLRILGLVSSFAELEEKMMGNPRLNFYTPEMARGIDYNSLPYLPVEAKKTLNKIFASERLQAGIRTYKFWLDLFRAGEEMKRVQKPGSKSAVIIGNNHYLLDKGYIEVQNDLVFIKMAEYLGFNIERVIKRFLEKTSAGNIRYESIVIISKP